MEFHCLLSLYWTKINLFKYCTDVENCESFSYIYIDDRGDYYKHSRLHVIHTRLVCAMGSVVIILWEIIYLQHFYNKS